VWCVFAATGDHVPEEGRRAEAGGAGRDRATGEGRARRGRGIRQYGTYGEYAEYPDEPVAECKDPESEYAIVEALAPPPDDYETRGWVSVADPIFREGCIEPSHLEREVRLRESDLVDCFHAASADSFSLRVRATFPDTLTYGYGDVTVELRFPERPEWEKREDDRDPVIDKAGLASCLEGVLGRIRYLGYDPTLPAVVDLPMERGFPVEGGVIGGVP
jgi:hypothetical protein